MTRRPARKGAWLKAGVLGSLVACHSARPGGATIGGVAGDCEPPRGKLPSDATAAGLAGAYRLHITATNGANAGQWVEGSLRLAPILDPAAQAVVVMGQRDPVSRYALTGSSDLDPASLGAVRTGALDATDPEAPGVLVMERHPAGSGAPAEIILRLGADANQRARVRYDGGYFALLVRGVGPRGFTGTWSSGSRGSSADGFFCAERVGSER